MNFKHIETLPGSPQPNDIFEPYMPSVDLLSNMSDFFAKARELLDSGNTFEFIEHTGFHQLVHQDDLDKEAPQGQRYVAIITPGRMISLVSAPPPNTKFEKELAPMKVSLPSETPIQITAISYTKLEAYMEDKTKTKCIPFLGYLLAFAYFGHNVIVFEGHSSALEFGVKNSDVLFIDSGMLPFMAENWANIVFQAMKPNPKIFIHERKNFGLIPVVKKNNSPGWQYSEPDGEASYTNVLLTTLAKEGDKAKTVSVISGQSLPNPKEFATDADELEYISTLPFRYEKLNADIVIKLIWDNGKFTSFLDKFQSTRTLKTKLAESNDKVRDVSFQLRLSKTSSGKQQLEVKLS